MRFTSKEAFEASAAGEPIMMEQAAAYRCINSHGASIDEFLADLHNGREQREYDAAAVLGWLGY